MWTPDSRSLLFATADGGKRGRYRINVDNGTLRPLDPSFPLQAKLDPEGRRVVYHSGGNAFELWTLENFLPRRGDDVDETLNVAVSHGRRGPRTIHGAGPLGNGRKR